MDSKAIVIFTMLGFFLLPHRVLAVTVNPGSSIQSAISASSTVNGNTVTVKPGTYNERFTINKRITVVCETKHACIIKGAVLSGNAVLDGFYSLNSSTNDGAIVASGSNNIVKNNKVEGSCMVGIVLNGSQNLADGNEISRSHQCTGNSGADADGFRFWGSDHIFQNNYIHDIFFSSAWLSSFKPPHIDCFQTWGNHELDDEFSATNITFRNNICDNYDAALNTADREGTQGSNLEDCNGCRFDHNYIHVYGKSLLWESSSANSKAEYNILVSGPVIQNASSGQYGLFGNAVANYNIFSNFKNGGTETLKGPTGTGNVKNAGDLPMNPQYHPVAGSLPCSLGGSYVGAFPCGTNTGATATVAVATRTPTPFVQVGQPGDATGEGDVDGADYIVWRNHYGQNVSGASYGNFNNQDGVDGADYIVWRNHYGQ